MWDKMGFEGSAHGARSLEGLRVWVDRKTRTPLKEPQTLRRHIERIEGVLSLDSPQSREVGAMRPQPHLLATGGARPGSSSFPGAQWSSVFRREPVFIRV